MTTPPRSDRRPIADIIPLHEGGDLPQRGDQRTTVRILSEDRLFLQVVECDEAPERIGTTLCCNAENYSAGGIQFLADLDLPPGTRVDLWIDVRDRPGKFFLTAEVVWSRTTPSRRTRRVGARFLPSRVSDLGAWLRFQQDVCVPATL